MSRLDREIVLQTMRGYEEVNRITESERRARLKGQTPQESLSVFKGLFSSWACTGRKAGGNWETLTRRRLEHHLSQRQAFEILARAQGYI